MKKIKNHDPKIASPPGYIVPIAARAIITVTTAIVNLVEVRSLMAKFMFSLNLMFVKRAEQSKGTPSKLFSILVGHNCRVMISNKL